MRKFLSKYFPLIPVAIVLISVTFSHGCANTTTPPTGGDKDTIPPVIKKMFPLPGSVNVPRHKTRIVFTFNEYVKVTDPKNIYLSPPLEKAPKYKIDGKSVVIWFESDLDSATTYTLDLTGAIADNNENNPFPGYTLVFSTGDQIDSLMMTGTVQDCNTLLPIKGATVMLYKDQGDSAIFLKRPVASAKTDDWGYFSIRNIADTVYRVYAIVDANGDNLYQSETEKVAFLDTLFRPSMVVADTLPELAKYDMKDTALCMARKSEVELNIFREKPSKQYIVKKERVGLRTAYLTFMAPGAVVYGMKIRGIPKDKLITQFNIERDSLEIWVNDQRKMPDTLSLLIGYDKTDSMGFLMPTKEEIPLVLDKKLRASLQKSSRRDIKHEDTICVMTAKVEPETVEQYGFSVEFKYPLIEDAFDSLGFRSVNPRQQEKKGTYKVTRDSTNLRHYTIMPDEKLMPGYEYFLKIPYRKFRDINGFYNDSTELKVSLPNDEKLSSLTLNITGTEGRRYIVDLLTEKRDKVVRSFIVDFDQKLLFPYIKAAKFCIRLTEDLNRNGIVETGIILERQQPEKVRFFKLNDSFLIDIPQRTELEQDIKIEELFK